MANTDALVEAIIAALGDHARLAAKEKRREADARAVRDRMHAEAAAERSLGKAPKAPKVAV
jgi:hypothetical protein